MRLTPLAVLWVVASFSSWTTAHAQQPESETDESPFRIAILGLTHGHVEGLLWHAREHDDLVIVGVWEPDVALFDRLAEKYDLGPELRHTDPAAMLDAVAPEAAAVMTSTAGHLPAVRLCAPRGIDVMVEKPLAINLDEGREMAQLAEEHDIEVLTNYETSWYASNHAVYAATRADGPYQPIRRVVFRHGHRGPIEIGVSDEFLAWLLDRNENGDGALHDFGCYGANLMTWLMEGRPPQTVTATLRTLKPATYAGMTDDATLVLGYEDAVAVVQGSWAWTHDNKETVVYTDSGSLHAGRWSDLSTRAPDQSAIPSEVENLTAPYDNPWSYLAAVSRDEAEVEPLSSLANNLIVMEILDAAVTSAQEGRTVTLRP